MASQQDALEACVELQRRLNKTPIGTPEWMSIMNAIARVTLAAVIKQVETDIALSS